MKTTKLQQLFAFILMLLTAHGAWGAQNLHAAPVSGQSATLLPDGRTLLLGGLNQAGNALSDAVIVDQSGKPEKLPLGLEFARAGHSATVLPDGTVFIFGGMGADGKIVSTAELYDPATRQFSALPDVLAVPRAFHTATLLTDGTLLLAGGIGSGGEVTEDVQLWDFRTRTARSQQGPMLLPRKGHLAELLADGAVRISGGSDRFGRPVLVNEIYDPAIRRFRFATSAEMAEDGHKQAENALVIAESLPVDGAADVAMDAFIALRLTHLLQPATVNSNNFVLIGPGQKTVPAKVTPAESGRLVFLLPASPLQPGTTYTLRVDGAADSGGAELRGISISFTTAGEPPQGADSDWLPNQSGGETITQFQSLPPLQAASGVTALAGQVLKLNGWPLEHVTLEMDGRKVETDHTGRFLLRNLTAGHHVLWIDGATANRQDSTYGIYEVGVTILPNRTNVLNYTIWMTRMDTAHAVTIPSPTTTETVITNPNLPGLELHLPAGTVITDRNGQVVRRISITPIPIQKPPFPLPAGVQVPIYFTIQPGGAYIKGKGARLIYPNGFHFKPETPFEFWNYDANAKGWFIYGQGKVSADGSRVLPDPGVVLYEFTGAMVGGPGDAPSIGPPVGDNSSDGDPINLSTGQFIYDKTDMVLPDVFPISFTRTYIANDSRSRSLGIGGTDNYDIFMVGDTNPYTYQELILPDGGRVRFDRITAGSSFSDAVYVHASAHDQFYGATLAWNTDTTLAGGSNWKLLLPDGSFYIFPDSNGALNPACQAPLLIVDRYGNRITLTRSGCYLIQIASPNGHVINLTRDGSHRITQLTDSIGRTVSYAYDSAGRLSTVTDVNGGVTTYTYDDQNRMLTIQDARGIVYLTNQYDSTGRVIKQTEADGGTYIFTWTPTGNTFQSRSMGGAVVSNGSQFLASGCWSNNSFNRYSSACGEGYLPLVQQVDVTDPRGFVRRVVFNSTGYTTSDTHALGQPEQQTLTYAYYADNLAQSVTDTLGRVTGFDYDSLGHTTQITRLSGTPAAVTTTLSYGGTFGGLNSVTDPLGHTSSFSYDGLGNIVSATDALGHQSTFTYNRFGQQVSATDPLGNTVQFGYFAGDLASVIDPLSNVSTQFVDAAGRLITAVDALGNTVKSQYNPLNLPIQVADAKGNNTAFTYDNNGNLLSLTDALNHSTGYTYDNMDRVQTRTDPLLRQEGYNYDLNGNLVSATDRKGQVTTLSYDGLNRLKFVGFNTVVNAGNTAYESTISYTYDGGNRMTQAVDSAGGTITRVYDNLDRLTSETTPQGTISYGYDNAGRRTSMTVPCSTNAPACAPVSYTYDNANRLTQITQSSSTTSFSYDNANRRTSLTLPNGVTVSYSYDNGSRLTGIAYQLGSTTLGNLSYSYDQLGRRTQVGGSFARTGLPGAVSSATYDAANELTNWNSAAISYDANGNMLGDGNNTFAWNARNRLATLNNTSLEYDAFGRRIKNAAGTSFLYDGVNAAQELSGSAVNANLLSGGSDEIFNRTDSSGSLAPLKDVLGSTLALADSNGNIQTTYTYDPFGDTSIRGASNANVFQYTGRENEGNGLYYYRARYYSPALHRFISPDSLGVLGGSINLYTYVGNNPTNLRDPSGHCAVGGLINMITYDLGVGWRTLHGRKINYYSGLSGVGHILLGNAQAFGEGCALGKAGEILADLLPVADVAEVCGLCFPAGTPVLTQNGPMAIEKVRVGDEVLSRNRSTGKLEYKKVTALVQPHLSKLLDVRIAAEANPLQPTLEHPLFVRHSGGSQAVWVRALDLQVGDLVLTAAGAWTEVLAISPIESEQIVYNFEVEENHDYFVGATGLLVHNSGPCRIGTVVHQGFRDFLVDLTDTAPEDWEMATAPGETGIDARYVGDVDIGFKYAELKPNSSWGLNNFADQLERWALPEGTVALFRYDTTTLVVNSSYFLF